MKALAFFAAATILCTCMVPTAHAQLATTAPSAVEIEKKLLASSGEWMVVWTHTGSENWESPSGSGIARFEKRDGKILEVLENRIMRQVCTNEILIHEDGFTSFGCTKVPKRWTYVPSTPAFPFQGTAANGLSYRLIPHNVR